MLLKEKVMKDDILVSILIPNYNYAHYLRHCLDSVLEQTYPNFEVIFRDNNSTDNSFEIAMEYYPKFKAKNIYYSIHKNKHNVGSDRNTNLCRRDSIGDIVYTLASDDAIEPTFIEKCVAVFKQYPSVSMVMTHRKEIDETGRITETLPFYNQSCIVDGESQAAVFMMAGIAIPAQRICRLEAFRKTSAFARIWNVAGDWYNNYRMSMVGDIAYIKEPLVQYRVHTGNETSASERNLLGVMEHYQLLNEFKNMALEFNVKKPVERYDVAVQKLGDMCLRYAYKMLQCNDNIAAEKYLKLAPIFKPDISGSGLYQELFEITQLTGKDLSERIHQFGQEHHLKRTVSYDPPEGFLPLNIDSIL